MFVRNRNKKNEYIVLLTTDCSLSDREVVRIYGRRWSIEVFFGLESHCWISGMNFRGSVMT